MSYTCPSGKSTLGLSSREFHTWMRGCCKRQATQCLPFSQHCCKEEQTVKPDGATFGKPYNLRSSAKAQQAVFTFSGALRPVLPGSARILQRRSRHAFASAGFPVSLMCTAQGQQLCGEA